MNQVAFLQSTLGKKRRILISTYDSPKRRKSIGLSISKGSQHAVEFMDKIIKANLSEKAKTEVNLKVNSEVSIPPMKLNQESSKFIRHTRTERIKEVHNIRKNYFIRKEQLDSLLSTNKVFRNGLKAAFSQITLMSDTQDSLRKCYTGSARRRGPYELLKYLEENMSDMLPVAHQAISDHILKVFCSSLTSAKMKSGDIRYSLVYMSLALSLAFKDFFSILLSCIFSGSPYSYPGVLEDILLNPEANLNDLGRDKDMTDSKYILKVQGLSAFLAAICEADIKILRRMSLPGPVQPDFLNVFPFDLTKSSRLFFAWNFIAGHLNSHISRFLPYILIPFISVSISRLKDKFGTKQLKKLMDIVRCSAFIEKCKEQADTQDIDRFKAFQVFVSQLVVNNDLIITKPGPKGKDVRKLPKTI